MKFKHTFRHVDVSKALQLYTEDLFEKTGRFLINESSWRCYYSFSQHNSVVEVEVQSSWGRFKAKGKGTDFYAAVDACAEKVGKQITKMKEKHKHHKKAPLSKAAKMRRLNPYLEYDNRPYLNKKTA